MRVLVIVVGLVTLCVSILSLALILDTNREEDRCKAAGGLYVRTANGYGCIRAEIIDTAPPSAYKPPVKAP